MHRDIRAAEPGAPLRLLHDHTPERLPDVAEGRRAEPGQPDVARPNVVIGPRDVVERLHAEGETGAPVAFARSRGNTYLVRAGNPKGIRGVADLLRPDVVPFMSNPDTEAASYGVYQETILATAGIRGLDVRALERRLSGEGDDVRVRGVHPPS